MKKLILLLLLVNAMHIYGQDIENIEIQVVDEKIEVTYDIVRYSKKYLYDVKLTFLSTNTINPISLTGDVGKGIVAGGNKKIVWDIYKDLDGYDGGLKAIVEIINKEKIKYLGGPQNALLSCAVPGLGDYFVSDAKLRPALTTVSSWGLIGFGLYKQSLANKYYDDYKADIYQIDMDKNYDLANKNYNQSMTFISIGAAIWIADIAYVTYKGFKNRPLHPYCKEKDDKPTASYFILPTNKSTQFGLLINF